MHTPKNHKQKSGYKFIYQRKSGWEVAVPKNGHYGYIGTFKEISDAVKARDRALCESLF